MCGRVCACVWQPTPRTADVTIIKNRRLYSRPNSHESVIFFVFFAFILFTLRTDAAVGGRGGGLDFAPMTSQLKWA